MKFQDIKQFTRENGYEINMPLFLLDDKIKEWVENSYFKLDLNPDFQRGHVWTMQQQIAFMEYLLKGGKSGRVLYFNKPSWQGRATTPYDDFVIVDGLQRLTSIIRFLRDEIPVFGFKRSEYEDKIRISHDIRFNINNLQTKAEVLQWYLEMNTGGTVHTEEEINKVKRLLQEST